MPGIVRTNVNRRLFMAGSVTAGLAACVAPPPAGPAGEPIVETASGKVQGYLEEGVKVFKGIPYGASTAGQGRFRAPKPPQPWAGVKQAIAYGPPSPQGRPASMPAPPPPPPGSPPPLINNSPTGAQSEDCLVLNVWSKELTGRKPVMVWLHGGGFSTGAGSSTWYDGVRMATKQDVVVVTINHRLNVFGYLYLDDISKGAYADSATAGMLDCVLALQWVKQNIERFGGDPNRVLIFGESGGARKTSSMMAIVPAQGLFHRAVAQSGSQLRLDSKAVANERTLKLLRELNISEKELNKLHDIPMDALLTASPIAQQGTGQFRPVAGTAAIPAHPFDPGAPVMSANVPMMAGSNRTEASVFLGPDPRVINLDEAGLQQRVQALVPAGEGPGVVDMYRRIYPKAGLQEILYMTSTDRGYFLDTTIMGERKAAQNRAPAYVYQFYRSTPVQGGRYFTPHASEIPFVFDTLRYGTSIGGEPTASAQDLSDIMSEAWCNFARTGDPNGGDVPAWPKYDGANRPTMVFDEKSAGGSRVENDPRSEQRKRMLGYGSQQYGEREAGPA